MIDKLKETIKNGIKSLKSMLAALFLVSKRKDTPIAAKVFAVITVAYALSPIDLIPDFIPILGYLDDAIILPILILITIKLIPKKILNECINEARDMWQNSKPKKFIYAIPIIIIWLIIIGIVLYKIFIS